MHYIEELIIVMLYDFKFCELPVKINLNIASRYVTSTFNSGVVPDPSDNLMNKFVNGLRFHTY